MPTPRAFLGLEEPFPESRTDLWRFLSSRPAPPRRLHAPTGSCLDAPALASNTPGIDRRDQGVARPLVRATARHPKRLSSYCATTTDAVGGHSARIRPRRRTSRTLSPRHPSSIRVNGLSDSFAARGLELIVFYDDEGEPSQMRATDECHAHDFDKHPRFVRRPTSSSLRP